MITVYPQEIKDGIANLVKANASIAYLSEISKAESEIPNTVIDKMIQFGSSKANRNIDKLDLYPIQTILVSTGCNINLDIFTKEETWAARFSAEDKPFNFMHQQRDIIGHITDNFIIGDNGELISPETPTKEVPDKFHIVTPAVIYRLWEDKVQKDRIEKLIAEIEQGNKWFVSMECIFADFDYGIISPEGESRVITRNAETAGLTKFLRQYGGKGIIDGKYIIGRALKKIVFSGKGLVSNPANPESIIFKNTKTFTSISADLGYINLTCSNTNNSKGKSVMAEELTFNIEDHAAFKLVKVENENLKASNTELTKQLSEKSSKATSEQIASLEAKAKSLQVKLDETLSKLTKAEGDVVSLTEANKKAEVEKDEAKKDAEKMKKEKVNAERVASLVSLNASTEEANKVVAEFADLSDDKFNAVVALISNKWSTSDSKAAEEANNKTEEEKTKDIDKDGDCKVQKVVDTAKAEADADLGVTDVNDLEPTRAAINDWFKAKVRGKAANKKD